MTSSGKIRIYELSKDLGLENKDVLERLKTDQDYVYALLADLEKAQK